MEIIKYAQLRLRDFELKRKIKIRAAKEGKDEITVVEQALKDYLKKPLVH